MLATISHRVSSRIFSAFCQLLTPLFPTLLMTQCKSGYTLLLNIIMHFYKYTDGTL